MGESDSLRPDRVTETGGRFWRSWWEKKRKSPEGKRCVVIQHAWQGGRGPPLHPLGRWAFAPPVHPTTKGVPAPRPRPPVRRVEPRQRHMPRRTGNRGALPPDTPASGFRARHHDQGALPLGTRLRGFRAPDTHTSSGSPAAPRPMTDKSARAERQEAEPAEPERAAADIIYLPDQSQPEPAPPPPRRGPRRSGKMKGRHFGPRRA